ncbi:hypothetical protein GMORB2_5291 [Geosmithia morbida]|uniref:ABC1 atypical kinase-like domain-containing protein n=1 Tax=Geosmithia morbida TaxID=1094350 RepID=A0A9P5D6C8_9HYPO|nr:uncharacterized protein GMORB2_5291 [Geosmithia morbida]KAF4124625.1 hypothetical protein GMORB2_5291 [Geosmithia morbida]
MFGAASSSPSSSRRSTTLLRAAGRCTRASATAAPRRHLRTGGGGTPFQPMRPPSPSELGAPRAARQYKRSGRWARRLLYVAGAGGALYAVDRQVYASGMTRSLRTFATGLVIAVDYKLNFRPDPWVGGDVQDLHGRSARRIFDLLQANSGLYLKIGQAVAMQSAVLPPEFQRMFARMFDDAPQDGWADVEAVIREEFGGRSAEEVFGVSFTGRPGSGLMEKRARASASVAQVHWARLPDGREVAVKIQKREVSRQLDWDMWAFRTVTWIYSKWFDLPYYKLVPFITERLELELDFENEARNSETMRSLIESEKKLRGRVYIPTVYPELSSKRVLTTEWIEGVRLWDKKGMTGVWLGGHGSGSPGAGAPLPPMDVDAARRELRTRPGGSERRIKPERQEWRGRRGKGGLGIPARETMTTMVDLFSAQIFKWGVVHCDPHPGNMFVRRLPSGRGQLVLIDHGLYIYLGDEFRRQYGAFWKALLTMDNGAMADIASGWGIRATGLFASATLMRPYGGGGDSGPASGRLDAGTEGMTTAERHFAMQQRMRQAVRDMLADEDKWPKELVFLGRNMRIVQGNNQFLGSPVNRVKMMGQWASRSLYEDPDMPMAPRFANALRHVLFSLVMVATDLAFYFYKIRQFLGRGAGKGMEDVMEDHLKSMASEYGIELQEALFDG